MQIRPAFVLSAALIASSIYAADFDRTKPPVTPPIPDLKLAPVERFRLPNGLTVVASEDRRFPLTTVRIAFLAGYKYDPKELPGLSDSVAALLNQGTKTRNARQIAEQAAGLGGQITASSGPDVLDVTGSCLSEDATKFLQIMADIVQNASFPDDEVELQKHNRLQVLRAERAEADYAGREALAAALFGGHPYSHIGPTEQSLGQMNKTAFQKFRDSYLVPNNAFLILVGRLPEKAELERVVTAAFGSWQRKPVPAYQPPSIPGNKKTLVLVDRPGSVQANVFSAHITPTYSSPDYFPLAVGDMVLGGGTSSRLFQDIREKRGFAYDAHTENEPRKESGAVIAVTEVRNEVVEPAVEALNNDLAAMSKQNVSPVELSESKNYYAGRFILRLERQAGMAEQLMRVETMGLPEDYLSMFTTHVRSVEPDQIRKTGKYWDPDTATMVVVGDASKIGKSLEKFGSVSVVKPDK